MTSFVNLSCCVDPPETRATCCSQAAVAPNSCSLIVPAERCLVNYCLQGRASEDLSIAREWLVLGPRFGFLIVSTIEVGANFQSWWASFRCVNCS